MRKYFFTMLGLIIQMRLRKCNSVGKYFSEIMENPPHKRRVERENVWSSRSQPIWSRTTINNMTKTNFFVWRAKRMIFLDNKKGKSVSMNCKRFINSKRAELLRLSKVYVRKHIPYLIFSKESDRRREASKACRTAVFHTFWPVSGRNPKFSPGRLSIFLT